MSQDLDFTSGTWGIKTFQNRHQSVVGRVSVRTKIRVSLVYNLLVIFQVLRICAVLFVISAHLDFLEILLVTFIYDVDSTKEL